MLNKLILMGRLTRDPELRYSKAAVPMAICNYTLAVDRDYKREGQQTCDFINITSLAQKAEFASKYFKKGQLVSLVGRLQINVSDGENGKKNYFTSMLAEEQHFAGSKKDQENGQGTDNKVDSNGQEGFFPIDNEDDTDLHF